MTTTVSPEHQAEWDWQAEATAAGADRDGRFNAAAMSLPGQCALIWQTAGGQLRNCSGSGLRQEARAIATALAALGVRPGDRVAGLLSRSPSAFAAALGAWQLGALYVPLFSGFGGDGLRVRLDDCEPKVIVTDSGNRASLDTIGATLNAIPLIARGKGARTDARVDEIAARATPAPPPVPAGLHDVSTIMYTSGTTGRPKGCLIPHRAVVGLRPYVRHCLSVAPGDILLSGADPGWSFGLFTTGLAPMSMGASRVVIEGGFSPERWWQALSDAGASHLAAAPTAFRQLAAAGRAGIPAGFAAATSAGEPLDAPTFEWFRQHAGVAIHDSYGLSEVGMVIGGLRTPGGPLVVPDSMGVALPGFEIRLLDPSGGEVAGAGQGRIAVRDNGFFLSRGYWGREPEWDARFADGWFLTEDLARRDELGRYSYVARNDDIIVTAGYNVGPAEVEAALLDHELVTDAACAGVPDPRKGQAVAAYVVLAGDEPPDLLDQLRRTVGQRVGWHAAPRAVFVRAGLPRTESGKLMRSQLAPGEPVPGEEEKPVRSLYRPVGML